jgi:internalin A
MNQQEVLQKIEQAAKTGATTLDLSVNQLSSLHPQILQLSQLQRLYLSRNNLRSLPPEIGQLTQLQRLNLSHNNLRSLPPQILQLSQLQQLDLSDNHLSSLPPEIGQLSQLQRLYLSDNHLSSLSPEIGQLSQLQRLYLHGNPQLPLPPEVLGPTWQEVNRGKEPADAQSIIRYYLELTQAQPLNEAKVLLVGQGSVGKTSLVNRLLHNHFNPQENKTDGIQIQQWPLEIPGPQDSPQTIRLNVWDFGGQEIMHATHQFFLTRRSLYLLVLDTRQSEAENRLEYWLKMIESFGADSPILVVGNKADQHPLDLDQRGLKHKYRQIQIFLETSCQTGQGIDLLREQISQTISKLPHVGDPFPKTWFEVKQTLETLEKDYIPYDRYLTLCQQHQISDSQKQQTLVRFLHDLGIVLNFCDDPRLEDTHVLKPEWVTVGVYKILNDRALIIDHNGILDLAMVPRILDPQRYPHHKHNFIIQLMGKFELCFPLPDAPDQYLIPDVLPKEERYTGDWPQALTFEYHYSVLPSSILSRFIVRMNPFIHQSTYWRTGVVLAYESCKARVKSDREDKFITIDITGPIPTRRHFLTTIRNQLDAIHRSFPGLDVTAKVRLPRHPQQMVNYRHLVQAERAGQTTLFVEDVGNIDIQELLDGIETGDDRLQNYQLRNYRPKPEIHFHGPVEQATIAEHPVTNNANAQGNIGAVAGGNIAGPVTVTGEVTNTTPPPVVPTPPLQPPTSPTKSLWDYKYWLATVLTIVAIIGTWLAVPGDRLLHLGCWLRIPRTCEQPVPEEPNA